jgi:hypothetical protein
MVLRKGGEAQVLVHRFSADAVIAGQDGFRNAAGGPLRQLGCPFRRENLLPPFVGAALLGQGDAFALSLPYEGPFEFSESPMTESMRFAMGESSPVRAGAP